MEIRVEMVEDLIREQFPQWSHLPVRPVPHGGHDNRTFRLGGFMSVRLPSAERYVAAVEKEARWLPLLKGHLSLPIPAPIAVGKPSEAYPFPWSVLLWIQGETADKRNVPDTVRFAKELASFLLELHAIDASDGPPAGRHNFFRGGCLSVYAQETQAALENPRYREIRADASEIWELSLRSRWKQAPVWVHGDVAAGNLLVREGSLCGVIDFGTSGVGDPACDLVVAWTFFDDEGRKAFRSALPLDEDTWNRARGWALWKALITGTAESDAILKTIVSDFNTSLRSE